MLFLIREMVDNKTEKQYFIRICLICYSAPASNVCFEYLTTKIQIKGNMHFYQQGYILGN